jgi:hypothetical protein
MTFTVVGCGNSAQNWVPNGPSIGCNDCEKFGNGVDYLVLVNSPNKFKHRINTILRTKAQVLTNMPGTWIKHFSKDRLTQIRLSPFVVRVRPGMIYSSGTTPIICMSVAIAKGATKIILWGVDMVNHQTFRIGVKKGDQEISVYRKFFKEVKLLGIEVFRGADGTCFDNDLSLWTSPQ